MEKYEVIISKCNSEHIMEEDINHFKKDIKQLGNLIKRAKQEIKEVQK